MTSDRPPVIGITCNQIVPDQEYRPPRCGLNETYIQAVARAGGVPVLIPNLPDERALRVLYERLEGLLLSGGDDLDPVHYGEPIHEQCGSITPERDTVELTLARWAVEDGKPLLAICRGIQVLNVALGGSLYQDIEAQVAGAVRHTGYPNVPRNHRSHSISIEPGTWLAEILDGSLASVNSLHHQAIKDLASGLKVSARAPDQLVEGVEVPRHPFALGVQWHPEELAADDPRAQRLFDLLVEACRQW